MTNTNILKKTSTFRCKTKQLLKWNNTPVKHLNYEKVTKSTKVTIYDY